MGCTHTFVLGDFWHGRPLDVGRPLRVNGSRVWILVLAGYLYRNVSGIWVRLSRRKVVVWIIGEKLGISSKRSKSTYVR